MVRVGGVEMMEGPQIALVALASETPQAGVPLEHGVPLEQPEEEEAQSTPPVVGE